MTRQVEIEIVQLYDVKRKCFLDAELKNAITEENIIDWRDLWIPMQIRRLNQYLDRGGSTYGVLESVHWNWANKVLDMQTNSNLRGFSLEYEGRTEAMMIVDVSRISKLNEQGGKFLVYVDYVQSAPWNKSDGVESMKKFKRCGTVTIKKAIQYSLLLQREGRIGLHSLP